MTRTMFRGAFAAALLLAATFIETANADVKHENDEAMITIVFAQSSAELTFDAIRTLSNLVKDQQLHGRRAVIYAGEGLDTSLVTRLRQTQIKDLLIDLGLPPGQIVISPVNPCRKPYILVQSADNLQSQSEATEPPHQSGDQFPE